MMQPGDWVIVRSGYGDRDEIGEVVKVTEKQLTWNEVGYNRVRVSTLEAAVYSHATAAAVRYMYSKLKSARGEYDRRIADARRWHVARRIEIIAAANQGDE